MVSRTEPGSSSIYANARGNYDSRMDFKSHFFFDIMQVGKLVTILGEDFNAGEISAYQPDGALFGGTRNGDRTVVHRKYLRLISVREQLQYQTVVATAMCEYLLEYYPNISDSLFYIKDSCKLKLRAVRPATRVRVVGAKLHLYDSKEEGDHMFPTEYAFLDEADGATVDEKCCVSVADGDLVPDIPKGVTHLRVDEHVFSLEYDWYHADAGAIEAIARNEALLYAFKRNIYNLHVAHKSACVYDCATGHIEFSHGSNVLHCCNFLLPLHFFEFACRADTCNKRASMMRSLPPPVALSLVVRISPSMPKYSTTTSSTPCRVWSPFSCPRDKKTISVEPSAVRLTGVSWLPALLSRGHRQRAQGPRRQV